MGFEISGNLNFDSVIDDLKKKLKITLLYLHHKMLEISSKKNVKYVKKYLNLKY
ncbi:hypothetical protein [Clostridioides difficile]|uniref:hypothetical protein n=1 Tax=Clostridioides difficile TaxID=1496 RepID=UPI001F36E5C2|nr:hypothetical protein [Clostridioides difficile]